MSSRAPLADASAIRFDGVSKSCQRSTAGSWSGESRDEVRGLPRRVLGRDDPDRRHELHALEQVSFEVARGEAVALIGANGAGKSACLKLVSNIARPSRGELWVRGPVAALIQLGAGFHRELTGRENVYLFAAIFGSTRSQIEERYAEIVAFAELEEPMHTPLKHSSSGMQVRLGLAVAIHVDADVPLVDEVLAVGDRAFRDKSAWRPGGILQTREVTTLMVAHVLELVRRLCTRPATPCTGQAVFDGPIDEAIAHSLKTVPSRD